MAHHYVVTAHKPTAVTACVTGKNLQCEKNSNSINLHYQMAVVVKFFCSLDA
jgi:hypothetical protein